MLTILVFRRARSHTTVCAITQRAQHVMSEREEEEENTKPSSGVRTFFHAHERRRLSDVREDRCYLRLTSRIECDGSTLA